MPYAESGQVSLYYEDAGAARLGGVPILLLHELGGSSESWRSVVPLLSPNRRTIAIDLRGAGRSEKPPSAFSLRDHADDLNHLLDSLGHAQVDVLGSALGSILGALLASRHPSRVRRLMLCAVAADMEGPTAEYLLRRADRVRREGMRAVMDSSLANAFPDEHAAARAAYRPLYLGNDPAGYAELSIALARVALSPADWSAIRAPTLVCSGARDFIWPPPSGREVAAAIPGAHFENLTEAGHFPHLQTPDGLAARALAFFGSD